MYKRQATDDARAADESARAAAGSSAKSYSNPAEARALARAVADVLAAGELAAADIGVVTPYAAQARLLCDVLRGDEYGAAAADVEVSSVDGYQGREKELVFVSAVRSNARGAVGFLRDWRRLNVAITRARRGLVVFGDPRTLERDAHWGAYCLLYTSPSPRD